MDGFVAHVASFRMVEVLDIRPSSTSASAITFSIFDLTKGAGPYAASTDSLSCLHALEHIGLGRYGDTVDVDGWRKGLQTLFDILEPSGLLYLSVPIGPQRIEFDAHRVFSVPFILAELKKHGEVIEMSYVDDRGELHLEADFAPGDLESSFGCIYGCGIFVIRRNR